MNSLQLLSEACKGFEPFYFDNQGWNGNSKVFEDMVVRLPQDPVIVEVGSWKGQSTLSMLDACKKYNKNVTMYCIDTWLGANEFWHELKDTPERDLWLKHGFPQIYYQFASNIIHKGYADKVIPMPMTSLQGLRHLMRTGVKADLIYIDASHEYFDVKADIMSAMDIIKDAGIIFGDDYTDWPGVNIAVNEIYGRGTCTILENNFWVFENGSHL